MDEILVNNFMVFDDLVARESFDLWVGDEALGRRPLPAREPRLKRAPFVWMTDFVGWLPMPDGGEREASLTADYNAEMVEHVARLPGCATGRSSSATPTTCVDVPLGPDLPTVRDWTEQHFDFAGYVTGERPRPRTGPQLRRRLGYADDESSVVVSVGGSGVGDAPAAPGRRPPTRTCARRVPGLRMVVVAGPRIDPARSTRRPASRCTASCPTSTCTTRPATSRSSRAG